MFTFPLPQKVLQLDMKLSAIQIQNAAVCINCKLEIGQPNVLKEKLSFLFDAKREKIYHLTNTV